MKKSKYRFISVPHRTFFEKVWKEKPMKEPKFSLPLNNEDLTLKLKLSEDKEQIYLVDGDGVIIEKCNTVDFVDKYNEEIAFKDNR